jgi:hypothetical protein
MISWLVGDEENPVAVFDIAKASTVTELRNWAARRVATDPEIDAGSFPLFIDHSPWEGRYSAEEIPRLTAELEELIVLSEEQVKLVPEARWMTTVLRRCLTAARRAEGRQILIR